MANLTSARQGASPTPLFRDQIVEACEALPALRELQAQVDRAWETLRHIPGGAAAIFEQAIRRATPIVPCVVAPRPLTSNALNRDLECALSNYHPEEIRVVGFTLLSSLIELVSECWGPTRAVRLERVLNQI
ncbi:MAG: hypothetical protein ACE5G2_08800, partial [Candidatus Krumholzibacteriia bacterium]